MKNIFTEHPKEVKESYLEHMKHASSYAGCFFKLSLMSLIHAIFPWIYNGNISCEVKCLHDHLFNRVDCDD